jgi:hypothetical protein
MDKKRKKTFSRHKLKLSAKLFFVWLFLLSFLLADPAILYAVNLVPSPGLNAIEADTTSNTSAVNDVMWYELSNGHASGGSLPDFESVFTSPEKWSSARQRTSVVMFGAQTLQNFIDADPGFVATKIGPFIKANPNVKIAFNVQAPKWAACTNYNPDKSINSATLNQEINMMKQIEAAGGKIAYITMESVLSKPDKDKEGYCAQTWNQRLQNMNWYVSNIKEALPNGQPHPVISGYTRNIKYGLTDAFMSGGDNFLYNMTVANYYANLIQYEKNHDNFLDFVLLDCVVERINVVDSSGPASFAIIKNTRDYLYSQGIGVGIYLVSESATTEKEFAHNILWLAENLNSHNANVDFYVISSWYTIPFHELPDTIPDNTTKYTMTRNLKIVGQYILSNLLPDQAPPSAPQSFTAQ